MKNIEQLNEIEAREREADPLRGLTVAIPAGRLQPDALRILEGIGVDTSAVTAEPRRYYFRKGGYSSRSRPMCRCTWSAARRSWESPARMPCTSTSRTGCMTTGGRIWASAAARWS